MNREVKDTFAAKDKVTRISRKNQVTLPVSALAEAHMGAGAAVVIHVDGPGRITVRAVDDELREYAGSLPGVWPDDALESLRSEWR